MPNVIPQGVRNLFDSMNPGIQCGTQRLLTSYQKKHLSWLALPPARATGGRHRACPHCGSQHVVGQMVCLGCGAHIVKPSSQKQRKRIKTARWFAEEAASKASGKPRHQLTPEEVMSEMVRDYTTSRGSQSLDGEALDKAKQQLKLAAKRGYGTTLERFDNDVDYTMHSISAGYDPEFLAVEDILCTAESGAVQRAAFPRSGNVRWWCPAAESPERDHRTCAVYARVQSSRP